MLMSAATGPIVRERKATIRLLFNGESRSIELDGRTTLLDALSEYLNVSGGTKKGCARGQCGACTVHVAGRKVLASLTLSAATQGSGILTIEGLENDGTLHCMQDAFVECDTLQCGYHAPGQITSAIGAVSEGRVADDAIAEAMSGNRCHCGARRPWKRRAH
jgi:xanthine dehydrogenase YagT iron-sulfur-binding subunit